MADNPRKQLDEMERVKRQEDEADQDGDNEGMHHPDHVGVALVHTPTLGESRAQRQAVFLWFVCTRLLIVCLCAGVCCSHALHML